MAAIDVVFPAHGPPVIKILVILSPPVLTVFLVFDMP